jgi:carnitine O-palmitoyltransferase 2
MVESKNNNEGFLRTASRFPRFASWYYGYFRQVYPLDMSQFNSLFGTTRVPKPGCDVLKTDRASGHVIVMHKNRFYEVTAIDSAGKNVSVANIEAQIRAILEAKVDPLPLQDSVGLLTTENRDVWAAARAELEAAGNTAALDRIDSAMFVMCLDTESPETPEEIGSLMMHSNGRNRWFDKSFSFIVTANGKAAINFEHSWGDGVAVIRFMKDLYADSIVPVPAYSVDALPKPQEIAVKLTDPLRQTVTRASQRFGAQCSRLNLSVKRFESFGKDWIKSRKVSPDGIAQLAFQLAYRRMFGKTVSTYESASTSAYKHGRTECLRSATPQSLAYVLAHLDKKE